jgi:hypothetical protein
MKIRYFLILWAWGAAACCAAPALADARGCTKVEAARAEGAVASVKSWNQLHQHFGRYSHCDDGAIAEGFSESVSQLLAERWQDFFQFDAMQKSDPAFRQFVIRHIDETVPTERLARIAINADSKCPQGSVALCRAIARRARSPR